MTPEVHKGPKVDGFEYELLDYVGNHVLWSFKSKAEAMEFCQQATGWDDETLHRMIDFRTVHAQVKIYSASKKASVEHFGDFSREV